MRLLSWGCVLSLLIVKCALAVPRRALVVGNDSYQGNALLNARNDARSVAEELSALGYETSLALDTNRVQLALAIETFAQSIRPGDTALIYYAGHGLQVQGENYLVPTDFRASDEAQAIREGYPLSRALDKLSAHGAATQIIILDACRDNPFLSTRSLRGGWADMSTSAGTFLAFGTAPGSTASDDPSANHGRFTQSLLKFMSNSSLDIEGLFQQVRQDVIKKSNGQQVPWTASSLIGTLHLNPIADDGAGKSTVLSRSRNEEERLQSHSMQTRGILQSSSNDLELHSEMSDAMEDMRGLKVSSAIAILRNVLTVLPRYGPALRLLGIALHLCGRSLEAEQTLSAAILADPRDARAYAYRCLVQTGLNAQAAIKDCQLAISLNTALTQAHIGLALNLSALGKDKEAYEEVSRALVLDK